MAHKHGPKFFCEFCDTEVPLNARLCPKCGRFFASVRCPNCGNTGEHSSFKKGCPSCGYAMKTAEKDPLRRPRAKRRKTGEDTLPPWVYLFTLILLTVVLSILYNFLH